MRNFIFSLLLCAPLHAQDAPKPTVEQLQSQLATKDQQIAKLTRKLSIYQQGLFACQDAQIDAQATAQAPKPSPKPDTKEAPKP